MTHTLNITRIDPGDIDYTIDGPHDETCELWQVCSLVVESIRVRAGVPSVPVLGRPRYPLPFMYRIRKGRCPHEPTFAEEEACEYMAHGVEHRELEHGWSVPTEGCGALEGDLSGSIFEIAEKKGVGSYAVTVDYQGDGYWDLVLA